MKKMRTSVAVASAISIGRQAVVLRHASAGVVVASSSSCLLVLPAQLAGALAQGSFSLLCSPFDTFLFFFFYDVTASSVIYTLSLHDALPISMSERFGDRYGRYVNHGPRR